MKMGSSSNVTQSRAACAAIGITWSNETMSRAPCTVMVRDRHFIHFSFSSLIYSYLFLCFYVFYDGSFLYDFIFVG